MIKLLENKSIIKFLGIALSILLVIALVPQINTAYGSKDDVPEEGTDATTELVVPEDEETEGVEGEEVVEGTEDADPIEGDAAAIIEQPSSATEIEGEVNDAATAPLKTPKKAARAGATVVSGNRTISTDTTENLTFNDGVSHTLTIESGVTLTGNIEVSNGTQLTIKGTGTIEGTGKGSVITVVGRKGSESEGFTGSKLIFDGPTVTNGKGSNPGTNAQAELGSDYEKVGGGILIRRANTEGKVDSKNNNGGAVSAQLILKSGTIASNEAQAGGGIFIDRGCGFTMEGGTVSNNTATKWEGGGIYVAGNYDGNGEDIAKITGGTISNNKTGTSFSWGGGGIFVESVGHLYLSTASIYDNTASGLGGGISGCPHAKIGIGDVSEAAAIFSNVAKKETCPSNEVLYDMTKAQSGWKWGDIVAYDKDKDGFTASKAMDFYCVRASVVYGQNSFSTKEETSMAWTGRMAKWDEYSKDGKSVYGEDVVIEKGSLFAITDASLGLTATKPADPTTINRNVTITGNTSGTHGGGIGCNGRLQIGELPKEEKYGSFSLAFKKSFKNSLDNNISIKEGQFKFGLYENGGCSEEIAQAESTASGRVEFRIPNDNAKKYLERMNNGQKKKFTFYAKEKQPSSEGNIKYDKTTYQIEVLIEKQTTIADEADFVNVTTHNAIVKEVSLVNADGGVMQLTKGENGIYDGLTFINTIDLKASIEIPVTKTTSGVSGKFSFALAEVETPNDLQPESVTANDLTLGSPVESGKLQVTENNTESLEKAFSFEYKKPGTHWYVIYEQGNDTEAMSVDKAHYLVKINVAESDDRKALEVSVDAIWKASSKDAKFIRANSTTLQNELQFTNVKMEYRGFKFELQKKLVTTLNENLPLTNSDLKFAFGMFSDEGCTKSVGEVSYDKGVVSVNVEDTQYVKEAYESVDHNKTTTFYLKETQGDTPFVEYLKDAAPIDVTLVAEGARNSENTAFVVEAKEVRVNLKGKQNDNGTIASGITVTNRYTPNGSWQFKADKRFYGIGSASACSFSMVELDRAPQANEVLGQVPVKPGMKWTASVSAEALKDGREPIVFDAITYQVDGEATESATGQPQPRDDRGDHFYLITETGNTASKDTTAYVVKVNVAIDETDAGKLVATETVLGYADDLNSPLNPSTARPVFYNTDTYDMVAAANYSVYAASGEPVDQVCYVDPKVIKNLEGRSIKSGEFAFKLIEVQNYNDTEGQLISATANDEFGMVDFDKANNVSGDLENPSCLVYSRPGTYYYRVIEDTSQGGMKDQSVVYSDQIITFTTVIEQDEATGQLVCTDMYYGWWDKEAGKNVRYDEQYLDYADQPSNIGDMSKLNTNWHPTITNRTRAMDLQVRKTSVTDRDEGLVGATYALYAVNDNAQGDVMLAEATSEEGGWITYKNVSLTTNNLYYFKEVAAPAGHTVSEFRSPYFYLVEDATSPNGYTLKYADKKDEAASALAAQAEIAAMATEDDEQTFATDAQAADSRAGDDQQPGHSADGNVLLIYDRDGGVYDEATQLDVNKLDTRTHEWVEGAELAIIEKDTGREVVRWTSGKASKQLEKVLNVGTAYILRELKAPENYQVAGDVEFVIDDYGAVSITKGNSNGNAELSGTTITLYDTMLDAEVVDRVERPADGDLAQTGDWLPIAGLASVGLAALIVAIIARRRRIN